MFRLSRQVASRSSFHTPCVRRIVKPCTFQCISFTPIIQQKRFNNTSQNINETPKTQIPKQKNEESKDKDNKQLSKPRETLKYLCGKLSYACSNYPFETAVSVVGMEICTIYGLHYLIKLTPLVFPFEFAISFAIARLIRRLRLPIDLLTAKIIGKFLPELTEVKLFGALSKEYLQMRTVSLINNYGLCFVIASRIGGVVTVFSIYAALHYGLDVEHVLDTILSYLPFRGSSNTATEVSHHQSFWEKYKIGEIAGGWAAAVVVSSFFSPLAFLIAPYPARALYFVRKLFNL